MTWSREVKDDGWIVQVILVINWSIRCLDRSMWCLLAPISNIQKVWMTDREWQIRIHTTTRNVIDGVSNPNTSNIYQLVCADICKTSFFVAQVELGSKRVIISWVVLVFTRFDQSTSTLAMVKALTSIVNVREWIISSPAAMISYQGPSQGLG